MIWHTNGNSDRVRIRMKMQRTAGECRQFGTTDWHYNTHHKGYVTALNNIEKGLETADRSVANGNYSQIGELKRRFTWNHSGTLLHDLYWEVLGGDGDSSKGTGNKSGD